MGRVSVRLRWVACALLAAVMLTGAAAAGSVALEWVRMARIENGDMGCSFRGGTLDWDSRECTKTASDGTVVEVHYPLAPSTWEAALLVGGVFALVLALESVLAAAILLIWRYLSRAGPLQPA